MAKIKLTKTVVETAKPQAQAVELRDTVVPGFLCNSCFSIAQTRASGASPLWGSLAN